MVVKRTIRNPRIERRAVRAAQRAIDRRPHTFWVEAGNALMSVALFVAAGMLACWMVQ